MAWVDCGTCDFLNQFSEIEFRTSLSDLVDAAVTDRFYNPVRLPVPGYADEARNLLKSIFFLWSPETHPKRAH